jgi:hypothetical protein
MSSSSSSKNELSSTFVEGLKSLLDAQLSSVLLQFSTQLSQELEIEPQKILDIWNKIAPDFTVKYTSKTEKKDKVGITDKVCVYIAARTKNACESHSSVKSVTGDYCSKHLRFETKMLADKDKPTCDFIKSGGENDGEQCTRKVSDKSSSGTKCSVHCKSENKKDEPKKAKKSKDKKEKKEDDDEKEDDDDEKEIKKIVLGAVKKNTKLGLYTDQNHGYVVDPSNKKIYARLDKDKESIRALTDEDVAVLSVSKLPFDVEKFNKDKKSSSSASSSSKKKSKPAIPIQDEDEDEDEDDDEDAE